MRIPLAQLTIIGYANRFHPGTPARKVPPIFKYIDTPTEVVMPPFKLEAGFIVGGTIVSYQDFENLVLAQGATKLQHEITARPDSILWVESGTIVHYESVAEQLQTWRKNASANYEIARAALKEERLAEAEKYGRIAFSFDERHRAALSVMAAVDRRKGNRDGELAIFRIATALGATDLEFQSLVRDHMQLLPSRSPLKNIAVELPTWHYPGQAA